VTAKIGIERKDSALLMPTESLVMEKANAFAFGVDDNKAKKRPIKIGFNDGKNVQVLEGLTAGDTVILAGKLKLSDGQAVQVATP